MKRIHVKLNPETNLWEVLELDDWESYYDDIEKYGKEIADKNYLIVQEPVKPKVDKKGETGDYRRHDG
jgi:hypothetical protein